MSEKQTGVENLEVDSEKRIKTALMYKTFREHFN